MAQTQEYWLGRQAEQRLTTAEQLGNSGISKTLGIYDNAIGNINKEIESIYRNFAKQTKIDAADITKLLTGAEQKNFFAKLEPKLLKLGIDSKRVFAERYAFRLSRLEALKQQIFWEIQSIAPEEIATTGSVYANIVKGTYRQTQVDMTRFGITPQFATLDERIVGVMLGAQWAGRNYSTSIWSNTTDLAERLPDIIGGAIVSGASYDRTTRLVRDEFEVGKYQAARLVRTETSFFVNEAQLQAYIDDGIEYYEFYAVMDKRTSKICRDHDGQVYHVMDAAVGDNYPPLHPNCRSTTRAAFDGVPRKRRRERDEVPQRFQNAKMTGSEDMNERWQKVMQNQMNPNKASGRDYNADMNILTRTFKGADLQRELGKLMAQVPQDYPLRPALENIAKINGWREDAQVPNLSPAQARLDQTLRQADIDPAIVRLNGSQADFVNKAGIKFQNERTGSDDILGIYDPNTNVLSVDKVNLDKWAKDLNRPDYVNHVVNHEIGHAVDKFATQMGEPTNYSRSTAFRELAHINGVESSYTDEAFAITKKRIADSIEDKYFADSIRKMDTTVFQSMVNSGETLYRGKSTLKIPNDMVLYNLQDDELFAESYALFHTDADYLQKNAPNIYSFISNLAKKSLWEQ